MGTIVKLLLGLILAIVRAFTGAFVSLFSRFGVVVLGIAAIIGVVLVLTGALSFDFLRRKRRG